MLTIEIALTDQCNMGCRYCYVKNRKTRISLRAIDKLFDGMSMYLQEYNQVEYCISLFGGEPLLAFPELDHVVRTFKNDPNCKYIVLVSNLSLLTPEIHDYIKSNNIGVSWSWDSLEETRPFLDKRDARKFYESKRELILSLTKTVKCIVSPQNVHRMTEIAQYFKEFGIKTLNMQYLYDDVWTPESIRAYAQELRRLASFQIDNPDIDCTIFSSVFKLWEQGSGKEYPCFAGTSGFCLSTDGTVYPCQRFAQTKQKLDARRLQETCKDCPLEGHCLAYCTHSGIIPEVCALHKITHALGLKLKKRT